VSVAHTHEHDHHPHHADLDTRARLYMGLKAAVLLGLGLYFAWTIRSDNLTNYINERFAWLAYIATSIFFLLGLMNAWLLLRTPAAAGNRHDHNHDLSWGALAIVSVPLILGTLIPSRPLGAEAVGGSISTSGFASITDSQTFSIAPLERNVLDWLRVFNATHDFSTLNGAPADVIGFVYREPSFAEDTFMLARYAVSCCVADASALGLPIRWNSAADLIQGEWVRVQGEFRVGAFQNDMLPVLQAASVEVVDQPAHPYLYP
jgi:uncharacterized repeat protein (TIGR03943 family)